MYSQRISVHLPASSLSADRSSVCALPLGTSGLTCPVCFQDRVVSETDQNKYFWWRWWNNLQRMLTKNAWCMYHACHLQWNYFIQAVRYTVRSRLRSQSNWVIVLSFNLTTVGRRAFPVSAANLWNTLPAHLISAPRLAIFWQPLKTFLCQRSYPDLILWHSELTSYCGPSSNCVI